MRNVQVTLTAPATNQAGRAFHHWLKDGAAFPGKTYQVLYSDSPDGPWGEDLPDSIRTAASGQSSLTYTDSAAGGAAKRFYRVRLVIP